MKATSSDEYLKLGRVRLTPGVKRINMVVFYIGAFVGMMMATFTPQAQVLILSVNLNIPESQQGVLSGNLTFFGEIIIILMIGILGALSDKIGRKPIFAGGFIFMSLGLFLYPSVSTITHLYLFRSIFTLGSAAMTGMLATVIADYAIDPDRGRASGTQGVMNGIGAVVGLGIINMPAGLQASGITAADAVRTMYYLVAGISFITGIVLFFGLQGKTNLQIEQRKSILTIVKEGLKAARDPGVALSYGAAFVSRGDLALVGTFLMLWGTIHGTANLGLEVTDAAQRAALPVIIAQTCALLMAPVFGIMTDRMNRVTALMIALLFSAVGYSSTFFISDPYGPMMYISAILIGVGEIGGVITSGVLIAQQAPSSIRGSVIGFFGLAGAVGILVASKVGGSLFDGWHPSGPFVLFGLLGFVIVIWALIVRDKVIPLNEGEDVVGGVH